MKFLDEAKIYLKSGDGGAGCVSFRREKFIEFGGPDGGNGGKGGDIIFKASDQLNTLIDFRYKQHFKAPKGEHGKGRNRTGHNGKDIIITIPVGTQILADDKKTLLVDLIEDGQTITLLHGGRGGKGNDFFKSSTNRAPRYAQPGEPGEEMWVWLQLKLIADVGLVGLPNAGKSTFLSVVSRAHPKIADYPFTTLVPMLGVAQPFGPGEGDFVIADLPGLIEGAHEGKGLGLRFLAHMERCAILLHLIDATLDDVCQAYQQVRREIKAYGHGISQKPEIIALNKADAVSEEELKIKKQQLETQTASPVWLISCVDQRNIQDLTNHLFKKI